MPGALHALLSRDHERLDMLLAASAGADGSVDQVNYAEFRRGLLRHIAVEERILFPELRRRSGESSLQRQLHRDHAAIAALLVPPPAAALIRQITEFLRRHNELEENDGGLYEIVENLQGLDLDLLLVQIAALPAVAVAPHVDTPAVRSHIAELLRDAEAGRREYLETCRGLARLANRDTDTDRDEAHATGNLDDAAESLAEEAPKGGTG